jgi:hypothetical protein
LNLRRQRLFKPLKTELFLFRKPDPNGGYTVVYSQAVANPKNNRVYMFIFESPEPRWDSAWKTGKQIMDTLVIDDKD